MSNQTNANTVIAAANRYGIPAWIPLDIARRESGLNNRSLGDNGTSFGLFQLHRGGLAPDRLNDEQLYDPATNADIAVRAMGANYAKGVKAGLTGLDLEMYVANNSGWPGHLGVEWTNRKRADYNDGLRKIYNDQSTENYIVNSGQSAVGMFTATTPGEMNSVSNSSNDTTYHEDSSFTTPSAVAFRSLSQAETVESYKQWRAGKNWLSGMNFFDYVGSNGTGIGVRTLITIVGLVCILLAIWSIVRDVKSQAIGGLITAGTAGPAAPSGQGVEGELAL